MMAFDKDSLQKFVAETETSQPPVFVGRKEILRGIEAAAEATRQRDGSPAQGRAGMIHIIRGAPGAGKSAILAELRSRSLKTSDSHHIPRVVVFTGMMLERDLPAAISILAAVGGLSPERWRNVSVNLRGVETPELANLEVEMDGSDGEIDPHLIELNGKFPAEQWQTPVIVAIDGVHALAGDRNTPHAWFLQWIQSGLNRLPLTLVLTGLSGTEDRVGELGLSRKQTIHEIDRLAEDETASLLTGFCHHFGIEIRDHGGRLEHLVRPCAGWPRHLHFALQVFGRAVLDADGDIRRLDWAAVLRHATESRMRHFQSQQSSEMAEAAPLLATVLQSLNDQSDIARIRAAMASHIRDESGWCLPHGLDEEGFLAHLVHQGALHKRSGKGYDSPIPAFRTYLIEAGGLEPDADADESPAGHA